MSNSREQHQSQQQDPAYGAAHDPSLAALLRALAAAEPEPMSCAECRTELPALYHLQAENAPLPASCQAALDHLAGCPDCTAEYDALQAVLGELAAGTLPMPAAFPTFDLSFMGPEETTEETTADPASASTPDTIPGTTPVAPPGEEPSLWQLVRGARAWEFVGGIEVRLRAAGSSVYAAFGTLPGALAPAPLTAAGSSVFRSETPEWQPEVLVLPAPDAEISVHLAVGPVIADNAVVMVKLLAVPSAQPIANTHITLRNAQRQLLLGLVTKTDGTAVFEQLPRGRYFVQVRHDKHLWEIPLVIVAASPPA
ncbi:MAG: carboxypeptidase-like regulatory domain-containing protein [Caldilineaceae bacterium]